MSELTRTGRALEKLATESRHLVDVYEAGDLTLGRKVDQLEGVVGALLDGFTEVALALSEVEARDRALQQLDGGLDETVRDVKRRLQKIQKRIWADADERTTDDAVRKNIRVEFDALWSALEVVAQVVDGSERVTVRDYFKH